MSPRSEMKVFKMCKGKTIAQVEKRMRIVEKMAAQKQLKLRLQITTLTIGE